MTINILLNIYNGPRGGAHQFTNALKKEFISTDCYSEEPADSNILLFNSSLDVSMVCKTKKKYPSKLFIQRVDGPIRLYNNMEDQRDNVTYTLDKYIADATIFQSEWSKQKNYEMGLEPNQFNTVIMNAPNSALFNRLNKAPFCKNSSKVRIIATSWSSNWNKGFKTYQWLDENLDFNKYEMTFVGNAPCEFKNIKHILPLGSQDLANELKQHDIFITASEIECCSNSLIEAMHCGLPAVAPNSTSHPEVVKKGGLLYDNIEDIPDCFNAISENYIRFQGAIDLPTISDIAKQYKDFMDKVAKEYNAGRYQPKQLTYIGDKELKKAVFIMEGPLIKRLLRKIKYFCINLKN